MNKLRKLYTIHALLLFLMLALPYVAEAQSIEGDNTSTSISITATATVLNSNIELVTISDMGVLDASLLQDDMEIYINPVFDAEAGIMRASGLPDAQIRVSYVAEMEITRRDGPGSLFFVYEVSGYPGQNQRESELLETTDRELRFNEEGHFFFWIGGRVDLSQAQPGNYDGEFTIEIEYM